MSNRMPCKGGWCWTYDQCFREILDVSYEIEEIFTFDHLAIEMGRRPPVDRLDTIDDSDLR